MYIACQSRDGNLDDFFKHENHPYPPSLSVNGDLRYGTKSDLLDCLCCNAQNITDLCNIAVDAVVFDGAVVVQMLQPGCSKTFAEYRAKIFFPYLQSHLRAVQRVDVVFDQYLPNSLKQSTRDKRGSGVRSRISETTKMPSNWQQFLRVNENKVDLFHFLTDLPFTDIGNRTLLMTYDQSIVHFGVAVDTDDISPCAHEEANTRLILHCFHAGKCGHRHIIIRTVDTDVVVLAVTFFDRMLLTELWVHFGVGRNTRVIAVHDVVRLIGTPRCCALPLFHAFSGCDTVSSFAGKGKNLHGMHFLK